MLQPKTSQSHTLSARSTICPQIQICTIMPEVHTSLMFENIQLIYTYTDEI